MGRTRRRAERGIVVLLVNALVLLVLFDSGASAANSLGVKRNDYNRDGVSDIVGYYVPNGCLYRFDGRTNGTVSGANFVGCGWEQYSHIQAVGDVTGDGNGDLIAVRNSDGYLARWRGNGSGGFTWAGTYGGGWSNYLDYAGVGDITRDGIPDLVAVRQSDGCLARWKANRSFQLTYIGDYGCGWNNYFNLEGVGDINGNGVGDLVAIRRSDGCPAVWYGNGNGGLDYSHDFTDYCGQPFSRQIIGLGDLNGDGNGDLAGNDIFTTSMLTWFSDGWGNFNGSGQHFCCFEDFVLN
jgi:hypothetical protein